MLAPNARSSCPECGSNPTNHLLMWCSTATDLASHSIFSFDQPRSKHTQSWFDGLKLLWPAVSWVAVKTRILSYSTDPERTLNGRSRIMLEEALRRGALVRQLVVLGSPTEIFQIVHNGRMHFFQSLPIPKTHEDIDWSDKQALVTHLAQHGVPTPRSYIVRNPREAKRVLAELGVVCIKPRIGSNGRHTFPHIRNEVDLLVALRSARKLCPHVVVQEHIEGNIARATCVGGTLVGFLESQYPSIVGDGHSTIQELVAEKNRARSEDVAEIELSPVHEAYIARRGYRLKSVLEAGKELPLTYSAGYSSGGSNREYGTNIHPDLRAEIERAARVTGLAIVGFDLILEDPLKGPNEQRWGIIEGNSLPWIDLHNTPYEGAPVNVAKAVWDFWEENQ